MQDTQQKIIQLQTNLQLFKQRVEDRRKLLLETIAFYKNNRRVSVDLPTTITLECLFCGGRHAIEVEIVEIQFHWDEVNCP